MTSTTSQVYYYFFFFFDFESNSDDYFCRLQKYYERHEELKQEYQANLKKFKEQEQQQQLQQEKEREGEAPQPIKTEDAPATSPENKEGNLLQCAESAVESGDLEDEAMEITQHEVVGLAVQLNHL